jgi:hypothetical protein
VLLPHESPKRVFLKLKLALLEPTASKVQLLVLCQSLLLLEKRLHLLHHAQWSRENQVTSLNLKMASVKYHPADKPVQPKPVAAAKIVELQRRPAVP